MARGAAIGRSGVPGGPVVDAQRTQIARLRQALEQAQQDLAQDQAKLHRAQDALDAAKRSLPEARRNLRRLRQSPPPQTMAHYRVQLGDSLWDLARTFYGDPLQWTRILDANWSNIADPDRLEIGLLLEIPLNG